MYCFCGVSEWSGYGMVSFLVLGCVRYALVFRGFSEEPGGQDDDAGHARRGLSDRSTLSMQLMMLYAFVLQLV